PSRSPAGCGARGSSRSATRRSTATSGPTSAWAATCTPTCAERANSGANATGAMTAAAAWPASAPISTRPAAADARAEVGHWEADTMLGAGQAGPCVLSLVERKTGYLVLGKLQQRTSAEVNRRAQPLIQVQPHPVRTSTV